MKRYLRTTLILFAGIGSGCQDKNTTAPDLGFLQIDAHTVEAFLLFDDFIDEVQVFGGFGSASDLRLSLVSLDHDGLDARALVHLRDFPTTASGDSIIGFRGGRVLLRFDTLSGSFDVPVNVDLFAVSEDWHAPTTTWVTAVDTVADLTLWTQPGGGALNLISRAVFDVHRAQSEDDASLVDTLGFPVDSATVAGLADPNTGPAGLLVAMGDPGKFLNLADMALELSAIPSLEPDSTVITQVEDADLTFMIDPIPAPAAGSLPVGGAPAWRTVLKMSIPRMVDGTPEVCGAPGCQVDLTEVDVNAAELVLTTRQTPPPFQPRDTTRMDFREVLSPELLPKSPLGAPLAAFVERFEPRLFADDAGATAFVPLTGLVRQILSSAEDTETVFEVSVALLSAIEPSMMGFASFEGPGSAGAPALRLLYTVANEVGLP